MKIDEKRGYLAIAMGLTLSLIPQVLSHVITSTAKFVDSLFQWMGVILMPGLLVSLALSGNVHDTNMFVTLGVSAIFYAVIFYLLLTISAHLRRKGSLW